MMSDLDNIAREEDLPYKDAQFTLVYTFVVQ